MNEASEVTRFAIEVADTNQEQANGIEQISTGLEQINKVTQKNSYHILKLVWEKIFIIKTHYKKAQKN